MLFILMLFVINVLAVYGQKNGFILKGYTDGIQSGVVKLVYDRNIKDVNINDSAEIRNGQFLIRGTLSQDFPYLTRLWLNDSLVTRLFFISSGYQEMHLDVNHFFVVPPMGTAVSKENERYNALIRPIDSMVHIFYTRKAKLYTLFHDTLPETVSDSLRDALSHISNLKDNTVKLFLRANPKSYVGLWYLFDRVLLMGYRPGLYEAYEEADESLKRSIIGQRIESILAHSKMIQKNETFPSFMVQSIDADSSLFKIDGSSSITLIDFWYSHCAPCIAQFDDLKKFYSAFHSKGFNIVSISIDNEDQFALWLKTIRKYKLPWPQFLDAGQKQSLKFGIDSFPYNFLVSNEGVILDKRLDMPALGGFLKKYFRNNLH